MNNIFSKIKASLSSSSDAMGESLAIPVDGYSSDEDIAAGHDKKRFYGFKLGDVQLLIDTDVRSEVLTDVTITPVPLMPSYVSGLCNVRGSLIPVYNMCEKLGINSQSPSTSNKKVLVLDENQNMAGIEIDEMIVSLQFDEQDMEKNVLSYNEELNSCITYCYKDNGENWFGFDHLKLFDSTYSQAL